MLLTLYKFFLMAWPFIKEVLLGDKNIQHEVKKNRTASALLVAVFVMFSLFVYITGEAIAYSGQVRDLDHATKVLKLQLDDAVSEQGVPKDTVEEMKQRLTTLEESVLYYQGELTESKKRVSALESQNAALVNELLLVGDKDPNKYIARNNKMNKRLKDLAKEESQQ